MLTTRWVGYDATKTPSRNPPGIEADAAALVSANVRTSIRKGTGPQPGDLLSRGGDSWRCADCY